MASMAALVTLFACVVLLHSIVPTYGSKCGCPDKAPPGGHTCKQQAAWGKCNEDWMISGGYCQGTCCTCPNGGGACDCRDVAPPGGHSCAQQKEWGKCKESWMISGGYCQGTCCTCPTGGSPSTPPSPPSGGSCGCGDVTPPGGHSCAQQKEWGKCNESWMISGGYCKGTCCRCSESACDDVQPPGGHTCAQQKGWGKCQEHWLISGGYCRKTCGRCSDADQMVDAFILDYLFHHPQSNSHAQFLPDPAEIEIAEMQQAATKKYIDPDSIGGHTHEYSTDYDKFPRRPIVIS